MPPELFATKPPLDSFESKKIYLAELECQKVLEYKDVAFYLGNRSKRYVEELVRSGKLISQSPGRVSRAELERYVEREDHKAALLTQEESGAVALKPRSGRQRRRSSRQAVP